MSSIVFVTGASRGFGKSLVLELAAKWPGSQWDFVLTSTQLKDSEAVAAEVVKNSGARSVSCLQIDFSDMERLETNTIALLNLVRPNHKTIQNTMYFNVFRYIRPNLLALTLVTCPSLLTALFGQASKQKYDRVVIINNHGSLGRLVPVVELAPSIDQIQREVNLNLTSSFALVSLALKHFPRERASRVDLINISSLAAIRPFHGWGTYCVVKAARDMLHSVVALEHNPEASHVRTLNYAPGPLDTDMQKLIRETDSLDSQRSTFAKMKEEVRSRAEISQSE